MKISAKTETTPAERNRRQNKTASTERTIYVIMFYVNNFSSFFVLLLTILIFSLSSVTYPDLFFRQFS